MSQWAEIRHLHVVEHVPKREIARRLDVDRKTVERALGRAEAPPSRRTPRRGRRLDVHRAEIEGHLRDERRLTAKRVGALLRAAHPELAVRERALRRYVAEVRAALFAREAFVHRTHRPGHTMEVDFGETWVEIAGEARKARYLVATLPACNAYFAKVYPVERLECLLDGILEAFRFFGGLTERVVMDNTSLAVREVLRGPEREENRSFQAFRGELALAADFCAPRKGWEKGSVEGGVGYVRENCFQPRLVAASFEEANARLIGILEADLETRRLRDGRTCREALAAERPTLRPFPARPPDACRTLSRVIDKFGHLIVDGGVYSVPIEHAYKAALARLFHDRVELLVDQVRVATHVRAFRRGQYVLDPRHVLRLLHRKHRAAGEATALLNLSPVFEELRLALREETRRSDREWVEVLQLLETHAQEELESAIRSAIDRRSPRLATIRMLLRRQDAPARIAEPVALTRADLSGVSVEPPRLADYDVLAGGAR